MTMLQYFSYTTPDCVGGVGGQTDNEFMYFNKCVLIN